MHQIQKRLVRKGMFSKVPVGARASSASAASPKCAHKRIRLLGVLEGMEPHPSRAHLTHRCTRSSAQLSGVKTNTTTTSKQPLIKKQSPSSGHQLLLIKVR